MSEDARFEDGGDQPLNLGALDGDDLCRKLHIKSVTGDCVSC